MNRIQKAYDASFRSLLRSLGARRWEQGLEFLHARARRLASRLGVSSGQAYHRVEMNLVDALQHRATVPESEGRLQRMIANEGPPVFCCDAGLGGLSRWLRAAGYESEWFEGVDDAELIRIAARRKEFLLTTDSLMMERGVLRDGHVPALWVSPALTVLEQLKSVMKKLDLTLRPGRCMACGGPLVRVTKERVWDRIPPKTRLWQEEYYECARCGQLFWHGTHWKRIREQLKKAYAE